MEAYIIAGGEGTRVKEYTDKYGCRKHEIPILGRPFNQHMEEWLSIQPIISGWSYCTTPNVGTGGAIKEMRDPRVPYLVLYGDTYSPIPIMDLYESMLKVEADMMVVTRWVYEPDYGKVKFDDSHLNAYTFDQLEYQVDWGRPHMLDFYMREHDYKEYVTNVGMYMIGPRAAQYISNYPWGPNHTLSLENDLMNKLFQLLNVYSYGCQEYPLYDMGTPDRIRRTEELMR